jgi:hypothetical protein
LDERKALRLQAYQEFIQSVDDNRSLLDSVVTGNETGVSNMVPNKKTKNEMALDKLPKTQKINCFKSQETK